MYIPPDIIRVITSSRMILAGHVACMGVMRIAYNILVRKSEGRNHSEELSIDRRMELDWICGK